MATPAVVAVAATTTDAPTGWWAHQDSNLEPRDSRDSAVSGSADYLFTLAAFATVGCGTLEPVIKGPRLAAAPR